MVNLPPDQNDPRRDDRILDFDELLALILAFLGIGAILWWGMTRDRGPLAESGLLRRQVSDLPSLVSPEDEVITPGFQPSELNPERVPRRSEPVIRDQREVRPPVTRTEIRPEATAPAVVPVPVPIPTPEAVQPLDISDVPPDYWAYPFIKPMFDQGYLPDFPSGQFQPDKPLTRAELASLINQAFVADPVEREPLNFSDVPSTYWAAEAIDQAVALGFMSGYPEGDFRPDQAVPRYEVLVSLATGLNLPLPTAPESSLQQFGDFNALPDWAEGKVAAAAENSLIVNHPNPAQLQPAQTATRAEIVAMIHQALVEEGRLEPVTSPYAVSAP
ncbi:MAG: S-layer homology domain-containing protein [Leptolyngbyaceae cyanobacterium SM2_3_12]|nr:S-layer homology domain-containing protein [Leptolyngbyaceae cyanobacterium SM2_3_12]